MELIEEIIFHMRMRAFSQLFYSWWQGGMGLQLWGPWKWHRAAGEETTPRSGFCSLLQGFPGVVPRKIWISLSNKPHSKVAKLTAAGYDEATTSIQHFHVMDSTINKDLHLDGAFMSNWVHDL